ncbi:MAG TPA: LAGLIDADG family homing endonuclease [Blastocatellia bacterium]|nr:LAGLIDADG family homing endonuclease [Blastocatellia bacterium]
MFDQTQSQILDGLMIGDGYIPRNQDLFYFGQRRANREYVEYIAGRLGIPVERVKDGTRKSDKRTGKIYECSELRTLSHPVFAELRNRWYRYGRKVVPKDLSISREFLLHWFLCEGACSINRNSAHMMICTDAFNREEVEYLQGLLESAGIKSSIMRTNRLRIHQKSIERFYDYVGECPVECLKYKWVPVENRTVKQQDLKPLYEEIFNLYSINGWSCDRIARKFETNYFSIRYVPKSHFGVSFGKNPTTETTCREGVVAPSETIRRASAACG